ncbi:MAG: F0F1 ATP synthase subunit gamma [Rhodospirillales bacterium]|nr:F0F1 ATP synthase subunit gamma [Alphaproteobacteria bacterium]USO03668.1 MAG: F0F1 ATP synthase subunit gamma [Rhodospirillales bacterium]
MPSLKEYRDRISSVKSTRKITSAMKMVAASKLKKAQEQAEASQPYAQAMLGMVARMTEGVTITDVSPRLLTGTGADQTHLLIVVTSDRGLCGGFNGNLVRKARQQIKALEAEGKTVKLICVGRKARDLLKRDHGDKILESFVGIAGKKGVSFAEVSGVARVTQELFEKGAFDVCTLLYNKFRSVLTQEPSAQQLIPFKAAEPEEANDNEPEEASASLCPYDFEPEENEILGLLLPRNLGVQIFRAILDSAAGEQAARMTAMDNATRNAGDMIDKLSIRYNRARQAYITKELIEIISGAEAV